MNAELWKTIRHFNRAEFVCHHCGQEDMRHSFVAMLDDLRERFMRPLVISSGYRCEEHNRLVSSTGSKGPHVCGVAADIQCFGSEAHRLLGIAMSMSFAGVGISQKSGDVGSRYIHLDMLIDRSHRPTIWSY